MENKEALHRVKRAIILAAGGRRLGVCNGGDMVKPGYREVFMKYCQKGIGGRYEASCEGSEGGKGAR